MREFFMPVIGLTLFGVLLLSSMQHLMAWERFEATIGEHRLIRGVNAHFLAWISVATSVIAGCGGSLSILTGRDHVVVTFAYAAGLLLLTYAAYEANVVVDRPGHACGCTSSSERATWLGVARTGALGVGAFGFGLAAQSSNVRWTGSVIERTITILAALATAGLLLEFPDAVSRSAIVKTP